MEEKNNEPRIIDDREKIKKLKDGICLDCDKYTISCSRTTGYTEKGITNDWTHCHCSNSECLASFKVSKNLYDDA